MFTTSDEMLQYPPPRSLVMDMDRRWKSNVEIAPNCPRCASSNTKFCYYNNYSLSQPRYFCKGCRRYWTKGGSLRNVPVGGGCRRNRRGKSVRVTPTERVSVTYSRSPPNDPFGDSFSSNGGDSTVQPGRTDGSDIDLALVFAKFLNQNSSFDTDFVGSELPNEENASLGLPNTLNLDVRQEDIMIECQKPSDLIGEAELLEGLPQVFVGEEQQEENIQEFMDNAPIAFGLQTLLGDEVVQEALWSDDSTLQNITWQPVVQLQEFESLPTDDQLKISTIPISDNWSSFDMSGFDVFLRP